MVMALKREEDVRYGVIPMVVEGGMEVEVKAHELREMVVVEILVPISMVVRGAVTVVSISVVAGWKAVKARWGWVE